MTKARTSTQRGPSPSGSGRWRSLSFPLHLVCERERRSLLRRHRLPLCRQSTMRAKADLRLAGTMRRRYPLSSTSSEGHARCARPRISGPGHNGSPFLMRPVHSSPSSRHTATRGTGGALPSHSPRARRRVGDVVAPAPLRRCRGRVGPIWVLGRVPRSFRSSQPDGEPDGRHAQRRALSLRRALARRAARVLASGRADSAWSLCATGYSVPLIGCGRPW
jgi:hypothetical protein